MFNRSSFSFSVITVLSILINIPCFALDPPPKRNSLVPIPSFYFSPPMFMPVLARLRSNSKIAALMIKAQNSQKDPKQQNKPPLTEKETEEVQLAIQEIYSKTVDLIKVKMQEVCDSNKCIIHFKIETDIQLAPGLPFWIDSLFVPTKNLNRRRS